MISVTSEVSANLSFQGASARSARPDSDPSAGNDSFAALVDSSTADTNNDNRAQDKSSAQAAAPRRADDPPPPADTRSRDNSKAPDKAAREDTDGRGTAAAGPLDDNNPGNADAARSTKSKSAATKSDDAKSVSANSTSKPSSEDNALANDEAEVKQDGPIAATANAVAVAISAAAVPADVPAAATPASDKATVPLAIAAAAIAATSSMTGSASAAPPAPVVTDPTAAATATVTAAKPAGVKADAQATANETVSAQVTTEDTTAPTDIALAASAATATSVVPKATTPLKPSPAAKQGVTSEGEQDSAIGTTEASTTAAPAGILQSVSQPVAAAGKAQTENGVVDSMKADAAGDSTPTPAAGAAANGHTATTDVASTPVNSSNNSALVADAVQPQLPSTSSAATAPTTQLTVTAATHAAVPLSGLAIEIAASAKSGKSRFEIRLDPADLGRIDVRIDVDRNGQVTSHLTVERPETLSMLRQDANQLQRALDNAGLSTGNSGLQFSLRDQSSQGQNDGGQSNPDAHRLIVSEEDSVPAVVAGRSYGRMLGASGGVDIRV
ncbi:MAG: flagellar hook-length control protein FliK [Bradyrhizobium sp.]